MYISSKIYHVAYIKLVWPHESHHWMWGNFEQVYPEGFRIYHEYMYINIYHGYIPNQAFWLPDSHHWMCAGSKWKTSLLRGNKLSLCCCWAPQKRLTTYLHAPSHLGQLLCWLLIYPWQIKNKITFQSSKSDPSHPRQLIPCHSTMMLNCTPAYSHNL